MMFSAAFLFLAILTLAMAVVRLLNGQREEGVRTFWRKHWRKLPFLPVLASGLLIICLFIRIISPGPVVLLLFSLSRICVDAICANKIIFVYWGLSLSEGETRLKRRVVTYHFVLLIALVVTLIENLTYVFDPFSQSSYVDRGKNPFWSAYIFLLRVVGSFVFGRAVALVLRHRNFDVSGLFPLLLQLGLCSSLSSRCEAVKASVALLGPCWLGLVRTILEVYTMDWLAFSDEVLLQSSAAAVASVVCLYVLLLLELFMWTAMPVFAKWQQSKRIGQVILRLQQEARQAHVRHLQQCQACLSEGVAVTELQAIILGYLNQDFPLVVRGVTLPSDVQIKLFQYDSV